MATSCIKLTFILKLPLAAISPSSHTVTLTRTLFPPACDDAALHTTTSPSEAKEIIISGFINKNDCNYKLATFSAIPAVLSSFSLDDIVSCRQVLVKQKGSSVITSATRPTPFIVRLRSKNIVHDVLKAKNEYILLHACDLDLSLLHQNDAPYVINSRIYFNEVLTKAKYNDQTA